MTDKIDGLVERLRGVYNIPVNDGCGPLNGSMVFTRKFETTPIMHEAATALTQLQAELAGKERECAKLREFLTSLKGDHHYECDDPWYSCPKSDNGCANESWGPDCNCGTDSLNTKIDRALSKGGEAT